MTILLLGASHDPEVQAVGFMLQQREQEFMIWNSADINSIAAGITLDSSGLNCPISFPSMGGKQITLDDISCCYWRWFEFRQSDPAGENINAVNLSILSQITSTVRTVNPFHCYHEHRSKPYHLSMIAKAGGSIIAPATKWLPTILRPAVEAELKLAIQRRPIIVKPALGGNEIFKISRKQDVTSELLDKLMTLGAITIQTYITGDHFRVVVVGSKIFAIRIESNQPNWKTDPRSQLHPCDEHQLSGFNEFRFLAHSIGLQLAGFDVIVSHGRKYVLECNPAPMSSIFQMATGLPIIESVCDLLMNAPEHGVSQVEEPEDA